MRPRYYKTLTFGLAASLGCLFAPASQSVEVNLTESKPYIEVMVKGITVRIQRNQQKEHRLGGYFAKTSRPCPPFCPRPIRVAQGVETVGEVEVFNFMTGEMQAGTGLLIDARTPNWFQRRTIPGAVNIPWTLLTETDFGDTNFLEALKVMGIKGNREIPMSEPANGIFRDTIDSRGLDFRATKTLLLFCNGPWCDQSPRAIRGLLKMGYPPDKLKYYRGGMNLWELFGLTTIAGE